MEEHESLYFDSIRASAQPGEGGGVFAGASAAPAMHAVIVVAALNGPSGVALISGLVAAFLAYQFVVVVQRHGVAARHEDEVRSEAEQRTQPSGFAAASAALNATIAAHASTLRTKRAQLCRTDEYGIVDESKWDKHVDYFIDKVLSHAHPNLKSDFWMHSSYRPGSTRAIDFLGKHFFDEYPNQPFNLRRRITDAVVEPEVSLVSDRILGHREIMALDGLAYEQYCAAILRSCGWSVRVTAPTGDQGADVIANRERISVAIQCKHYASNVGNKAVQEVIAARQFQGTSHAVVVSTAPFTQAAQALANKTGVMLLSQNDLPNLWTKIAGQS